jgi:hypothetical protein
LDLPDWLNAYLFDVLQAKYQQMPVEVKNCLDFNSEQSRNYIGIYFPRSYAETYCIFRALFSNDYIVRCMKEKSMASILVLGAGTGGDTAGLLAAIHDRFLDIKNFELIVLDGNRHALEIYVKVIERQRSEYGVRVYGHTILSKIEQSMPVKWDGDKKFDFILTSKMLTDLMMNHSYGNPCFDFTKTYLPMLTEFGICAMLDVTIPVINTPGLRDKDRLFPKIMNMQINNALRDLRAEDRCFSTLLPERCRNRNKQGCASCDFISYLFHVSHSCRQNDMEKIIYRVLAHDDLVQNAQLDIETATHQHPRSRPCD